MRAAGEAKDGTSRRRAIACARHAIFRMVVWSKEGAMSGAGETAGRAKAGHM